MKCSCMNGKKRCLKAAESCLCLVLDVKKNVEEIKVLEKKVSHSVYDFNISCYSNRFTSEVLYVHS